MHARRGKTHGNMLLCLPAFLPLGHFVVLERDRRMELGFKSTGLLCLPPTTFFFTPSLPSHTQQPLHLSHPSSLLFPCSSFFSCPLCHSLGMHCTLSLYLLPPSLCPFLCLWCALCPPLAVHSPVSPMPLFYFPDPILGYVCAQLLYHCTFSCACIPHSYGLLRLSPFSVSIPLDYSVLHHPPTHHLPALHACPPFCSTSPLSMPLSLLPLPSSSTPHPAMLSSAPMSPAFLPLPSHTHAFCPISLSPCPSHQRTWTWFEKEERKRRKRQPAIFKDRTDNMVCF